MLFTTIFSLLALAALGQSAPAPAELEDRASKYHCKTKYSGKLSGIHRDRPFSFTKSGSRVTYLSDHETKNVLKVEFQACSTHKIFTYGGDWVGRLKVKGSNLCVELPHTRDGEGLLKIAPCNSRKLTDPQTWRYSTYDDKLFWIGRYNYEEFYPCGTGYLYEDDGKPIVASHNQVKVKCGDEGVSHVRFFEIH